MGSIDLTGLLGSTVGSFSLIRILEAVVTALICLLVIRLVLKIIGRVLARTKLNERVRRYIQIAAKALLYLIGAIIVASQLGVDMTSLVALLSVCSLGVTLAAEDILGNVAGGLVILSAHPFSIGDFIEVGGTSGTVREITLNHTKLETADGQIVMEPNRELASSKVINYTVLGCRRVVRNVTASYDAPTERVKQACREALVAVEAKTLKEPAPEVYLLSYGESSVEYTVRCWTHPNDYWEVYLALGEMLRETFRENGVEMTYNHLNVHIMEKA